jgi:hypothetical protein
MGDAANGLTVCVLIDYQNIHLTARDVFSPPGTGARDTLVDPLAFALRLLETRTGQQQIPQLRLTRLQAVRVYRGMPSNHREPQLYSAAQRQHAMWTRDHRVDVTTRTLRYPYNWGNLRARSGRGRRASTCSLPWTWLTLPKRAHMTS